MVLIFISRMLADKGRISLGSPPVVVVTPLKPDGHSKEYIEDIKDNRIEYAKKHGEGTPSGLNHWIYMLTDIGYATFFPVTTEYELDGAPLPWAKIPAMRHALTKFPQGTYFWFLEQDALIMNPTFTIESHIMDPQRMEELMIKDQPVVLPESVIKTFSHLRGGQIDFVLTQDKDGLAPSSFVLRRGEWAKFFLDTWFDPLYRGYNFQRAETHALVRIYLLPQELSLKFLGTHCSVASYHSFEIGFGAPKGYERL
jgi:mannan polymerase II complex MNN11 subunit